MPSTIDESKFAVRREVPVLDEGTIYYSTDDGEKHPFPVTPEFLDRLCKNMNRRDEETGDLSPLVIGKHTDPKLPESQQPEVVGFARRWRVGPWKNGKVAAYVDFLINTEDYARCKRYPRRSSEVWLSRAEIDPISLLGATTPERDLGLVLLERHPDLKVTYLSREEDEMPQEKPSDAELKAAKAETGEAKGMEALMSMMSQVLEAIKGLSAPAAPVAASPAIPTPGAPEGPGEEHMSDEELEQLIAQLEQEEQAQGKTEGPKSEEPKSQNSSGYAGGYNTSPNAELVKLQRQNAELADQLLRHEYERKLNGLKEQGYEIEPDELNFIMSLPSVYRDTAVARIAKCNRKAPIGGKNPALDHLATDTPANARTEDEMRKAVKLSREKGISYELALEQLGLSVPK
jgi:hypothetical protein